MASTIALGAGVGLLGLISGSRVKGPKVVSWDEQPTTTAERGSFVPLVIGRRRVGSLTAFAGQRTTTSAGGKKGGGRGATKSLNYFEAGWDLIGVGTFDKLHAILVDNKPIYKGPLLRSGSVSGSSIATGKPHKGTIYWYWGEESQPVNTRLAEGSGNGTAGVGVASRWGGVCYAESRKFSIGVTPTWPVREFDVERRTPVAAIDAAPDWIEESEEGALDDGCNGAHAIYSVMNWPAPLGCGIDADELPIDCFNALAEVIANERIPINVLAADAKKAADVIAEILLDIGAVMPERFGAITIKAVRQLTAELIAELPLLTRDSYGPGLPETDDQQPPLAQTRAIFTFSDRTLNYKDQPVLRNNNAAADDRRARLPIKPRMDAVTDIATANIVADRRSTEELSPLGKISVDALRGAALLAPGDQFRLQVPGEPERVRALKSRGQAIGKSAQKLQAVQMRFGAAASTTPAPTPPATPAGTPPAADTLFIPVELLSVTGAGAPQIGVLRIPASLADTGASIIVSSAGAGYREVGSNPAHCFGGTLDAALPAGNTIIGVAGDGPAIAPYSDAILEAEDLSDASLKGDWLNGRQAALLGTGADAEIVYVRSLTALMGGHYRLNSVIRARKDTDQKSWPMGTPVVFFSADRVAALADSIIGVGASLSVKSIPGNSSGDVDPGSVGAQALSIVGRASRSLPVSNLRANGQVAAGAVYTAGADVTLTWFYRHRAAYADGAGQAPAGTPHSMIRPAAEGTFEIEIWSGVGPTKKRTLTYAGSAPDSVGVTYAAADNAADHGGSPAASFEARVVCVRSGLRSVERRITVTLV